MNNGFLSRMPQKRLPGQPQAPGQLRGQARQDFYAQPQPPMGGQMGIGQFEQNQMGGMPGQRMGIGAYEQNQIQRLPDYQNMQNMNKNYNDQMQGMKGMPQMGQAMGQGDINQIANGMPTAQMGSGFGAQMGQGQMFNPVGKLGPISPEQMQQMNQQRMNQANPTQGQMGQMAPGSLRGPARQAFYQGQAAGQRR